jgi:site-specific recombinase XerD
LLEAGVDIVTVQKLAGHASPITTAKYDRRGEETKRNAVQNLSIPQLQDLLSE